MKIANKERKKKENVRKKNKNYFFRLWNANCKCLLMHNKGYILQFCYRIKLAISRKKWKLLIKREKKENVWKKKCFCYGIKLRSPEKKMKIANKERKKKENVLKKKMFFRVWDANINDCLCTTKGTFCSFVIQIQLRTAKKNCQWREIK